jgi:hypothetical protein
LAKVIFYPVFDYKEKYPSRGLTAIILVFFLASLIQLLAGAPVQQQGIVVRKF